MAAETRNPTAGEQVTKLHRLTVNLTERAHAALVASAKLTGHTKTDTCNRALIINQWLEELTHNGGSVYVEEKPGEKLQKVKIV
jgi:acyl-CoA reductase-like NAD-dependent aldehyde dehydrogenase